MFQGIVNRAQHSVEVLAGKLLTKMAVAVPFVLAVIFGLIAAVIWLSQHYGSLNAYLILTGAFAVIGVLAAIFSALTSAKTVPASPQASAAAEEQPAEPNVESLVSGALNNQEILLALLGTAGPAILPALIRVVAKNVPLVVGVIIIVYFMFADTKGRMVEPATAQPAA